MPLPPTKSFKSQTLFWGVLGIQTSYLIFVNFGTLFGPVKRQGQIGLMPITGFKTNLVYLRFGPPTSDHTTPHSPKNTLLKSVCEKRLFTNRNSFAFYIHIHIYICFHEDHSLSMCTAQNTLQIIFANMSKNNGENIPWMQTWNLSRPSRPAVV